MHTTADEQYDTTVHIRPFRPDVQLPEQGSNLAAGRDIRAWIMTPASAGSGLEPSQIVISPGGMVPILTGLNMRLEPGWECQVRPRSSLALKHQMTIMNSPGTIDADFDGDGEAFELKILLKNFGSEPFVVRHGDRIAQLVVKPLPRVRWILDSEDNQLRNDSNRTGGWGSTGER